MGMHRKTVELIELAKEILAAEHPMTVRQTYYRLVSRQAVENALGGYRATMNALKTARLKGMIPWEHVEDRLRPPRHVSMWDSPAEFAEAVWPQYRRDVWKTQPALLESWLEKDALSGIFEQVLEPYGVTLNVGRGYDGWSSIKEAADRYGAGDGSDGGRPVSVIYFGDHDPSGEDMQRSLGKRLAHFGSRPAIERVAILREDIERYNLPPDFAKKSDTRARAFIEAHGDEAVELDALPAAVLRQRLTDAVEKRMDMDALVDVQREEAGDKRRVKVWMSGRK
ncbi:MAG: hypothetical protein NTU94_07845 [Planctomycetota bacterium]|nr:hypothetical protein [Planctomycetota bacterium]